MSTRWAPFLWRACHEIIPTRTALVRRHVGTNPCCVFCEMEIETEAHLFFDCAFFASMWSSEPFSLDYRIPAPNFTAGLCWLRDHLDESQFGWACVICWNIWNFRNRTVHDAEAGTRESLVARINDFLLNSYSSARFVFLLQTKPPPATGWQPPQAPFVKINFDAAVARVRYELSPGGSRGSRF